jgi:ubiquinone/menaquinone biosynthesis C-methylase UbiE
VLPFTGEARDDPVMAHSIPVPAAYSIRPFAQEQKTPLRNRAVKRLVRVSSALRAPLRWARRAPSLAETVAEDFNRYAPAVLAQVEGTAGGFRAVKVDEVRSELMCSALLPESRLRTFEFPKALHDRSYPDYYLEPFHGQHNGYLNTAAATSCDAMMDWMFENQLSTIRHAAASALGKIGQGTVIDLGMGTGAFLRMLRSVHPRANLIGIDLSPYMLALYREKHALAVGDATALESDLTATGLPAGSAQAVTLNFVLHEMPAIAVRDALREAHRLLAPGGRLLITDVSADARRRDRVRRTATLRAMHEPFLASFLSLDLRRMLSELGFGPLDTKAMAPSVALRWCTKR